MATEQDMRDDVVAEARKLVGTRLRHLGRDEGGIDCWGLLVVAFRKWVALPDGAYAKRPGSALARRAIGSVGRRITMEQAQPGDVVLMAYNECPVHFALLSDRGIIHACGTARRVVEHGMPYTTGQGRIVACYRVLGA